MLSVIKKKNSLTIDSECAQNGGLFSHSNPCLIGLCTGSLAAATVSCCRTLSELVPTAIHTVGVAFRAGWRAVEVGQSIEQAPDGAPLPWSLIVSGLSPDGADKALDRFCRQHVSYPVRFDSCQERAN